MVFEFKFPDVGEGITEGTLVSWDIEEGQEIKVDDIVAHVETDKAVVEIPSSVSGKVKELLASKGDTLEVGKAFMKIEEEGDQQQEVSEKETQPENKDPQKEEPKETPKETIKEDPSLNGIKAMPVVFHEAKKRGIDLSTVTPSGNHDQILLEDLDGGKKSEPKEKPQQVEEKQQEEEPEETPNSKVKEDVLASLSVKKLARELGIDINFVVGTGENGKITEDDVKRAKESKEKSNISKPEEKNISETTDEKTPQQDSDGTNVIELKSIRGTIASKMMESITKTAQVTLTDEVEVSDLVDLRNEEKEILKEQGVKLSYLPFIIKAVKHACKKYPHFSGRFNEENNSFEISNELKLGIAVDTPKGLMVPVIENAQNKSIVELAKEIERVGNGAKESSLSPKELSGSTFTITSVGSIAGQAFTPILNYPEAAILGIGRIADKPVVKDGEVVPGKVLTLSLTVDHRIIDGADAARFLKDIMELLGDPHLLLLEV